MGRQIWGRKQFTRGTFKTLMWHCVAFHCTSWLIGILTKGILRNNKKNQGFFHCSHCVFFNSMRMILKNTPLKFNSSPLKGWLEDCFLLDGSCSCSFSSSFTIILLPPALCSLASSSWTVGSFLMPLPTRIPILPF